MLFTPNVIGRSNSLTTLLSCFGLGYDSKQSLIPEKCLVLEFQIRSPFVCFLAATARFEYIKMITLQSTE